MSRLYKTKSVLRKALSKDIKDRKKMKKEGHSTKGITQCIQRKRNLLKSKKYWRK